MVSYRSCLAEKEFHPNAPKSKRKKKKQCFTWDTSSNEAALLVLIWSQPKPLVCEQAQYTSALRHQVVSASAVHAFFLPWNDVSR